MACILQNRLGLSKYSGALDYNHGCTGYIYGLGLAKGLIESRQAKNVLLLTAETYSKYINPEDHAVLPLFGDAATATLIVAKKSETDGIYGFEYGTDGSGFQNLIVPIGGMRKRYQDTEIETTIDKYGNTRTNCNLFMDGGAIMDFALESVPTTLDNILSQNSLTRQDIDYYVFHQANHFMLKSLQKICKLEKSSYWNNISEICKVIKVVEDMLIANKNGKVTKKLSKVSKPCSISDFMDRHKQNDVLNQSELIGEDGFISILKSELIIFVRCLEVYMLLIEQTPVKYIKKIPAIEHLDSVDWLLNFNYTDTFLRYYDHGKTIDLEGEFADFIHGRAGYNNLIIGIHETLDKSLEDNLLYCSYFKKYFQRIFFRTGMKYKQWLSNKKDDDNNVDVYIFGHSLDVTDGEVLRYIILNEKVRRTIIFYHNQDSYIKQINNLTRIIGKDNLITKVGNREIEFCSSNDVIFV